MRHKRTRAILIVCLALMAVPARAADEARPAGLQGARAILARWVETQEILSRERREWQQAKDVLTSRIEMLGREIALVEDQLDAARSERSAAGAARSDVIAQRDALAATSKRLDAHLVDLESATRRLYESLPPVLTEKVKPLHERMAANDGKTGVATAERFQNVLGILGELNRLNSEVTVVTEIRPLSDGRPSEVRTIYVGLAQAWYVSAAGEAGVGRPTPAGWTWQAQPALAPKINDVLEVLQSKASPHFVPLPVTLD